MCARWECLENSLLRGLTGLPAAAGDTTISYELILEKFRSIEKPIDRYLTLRDLLRLAPKVYYDLLLKHTEEILPYIYTVRGQQRSSEQQACFCCPWRLTSPCAACVVAAAAAHRG